MLFNSFEFATFFVVILLLYNLVVFRARSTILLIASYFFYAYTDWLYLILLGVVTTTAFVFGKILENNRDKWLLAGAIVTSSIPLLFFKYFSLVKSLFFIDNYSYREIRIFVPIGISFFTLQALSYLFDVYRKRISAEHNPQIFALYLAFFPQILAGPIERATNLIPQLLNFQRTKLENVLIGSKILLWGLFCKLVIADKIALVVNPIIAEHQVHSGLTLLITFCLYSFQIYYDFYGYTQIAIGIARFFGIRLSPNFKNPYLATSVVDFWKRWHITLSTWFRDYFYIPLGGKHCSLPKYFAVIIGVFCLSGLWHGASLNFLLWGFLHGTFYLLVIGYRALGFSLLSQFPLVLQLLLRRTGTFLFVSLAWIFFRVESIETIWNILKKIFHLDSSIAYWSLEEISFSSGTILLLLGIVLIFRAQACGYVDFLVDMVPRTNWCIAREVVLVDLLLVILIAIGDIGSKEFIYFRF